jgi:hypothetical protein
MPTWMRPAASGVQRTRCLLLMAAPANAVLGAHLFAPHEQAARLRRTRCRTQCSVFVMIWCISCSSVFDGMITICLPPISAE